MKSMCYINSFSRKINLFIVLLSFIGNKNFGQSPQIDSLLNVLKKAKEDSVKVNTLNLLAEQLINFDPKNAHNYGQQALDLSEKLKWKKGIANSQHSLGLFFYMQGDIDNTLNYWQKELKLREELKDKKGISSSLGNLGNVYNNIGDPDKALEYYTKALITFEELGDKLKIAISHANIGNIHKDHGQLPKALESYLSALKTFEELGDKNKMSSIISNIGNVYKDQGNYQKALENYFKALKLAEESGNKKNIATNLGNIGIAYHDEAKEKNDRAKNPELAKKVLDYYFRALKIDEELGNKPGIGRHLGNIAIVYSGELDFEAALDYYLRALKIDEEMGNKSGIARHLNNIGSTYLMLGATLKAGKLKQDKFKEAEIYLKKALEIGNELGYLEQLKSTYSHLSELYTKAGKHELALYYFKYYITARDSMFNEENTKKTVRAEMNFEFDKKEAVLKEQQEKEKAIAEQKSQKQKLIIWAVVTGLLLVIIFAGIILRALRLTKLQKNIIEEQKKEVESQKSLVDEKQKEILDSIKYARRIQMSLLPREKYIERNIGKSK